MRIIRNLFLLTYMQRKGENIDEALNLAQKAKEQVPDDPHISDTLGWIYYKKNVPSRAIVYLKEANEKVPNQPADQISLRDVVLQKRKS